MPLAKEGNKKNLYEQVYLTIKDQIIKGVHQPGEKLKESKLAELLNTSRTPIREALRRLEMEGLVVSRPSHGVEVTNFDVQTLDNLFKCNSVLEGLAARQAAENIDNQSLLLLEDTLFLAGKYHEQDQIDKVFEKNTLFHDTIVQSSKNTTLIQMVSQIRSLVLAYRSVESSYKFRPTFMDEHWGIFQAIKSRNPEQAEELMRKHILNDGIAIKKYKDPKRSN